MRICRAESVGVLVGSMTSQFEDYIGRASHIQALLRKTYPDWSRKAQPHEFRQWVTRFQDLQDFPRQYYNYHQRDEAGFWYRAASRANRARQRREYR